MIGRGDTEGRRHMLQEPTEPPRTLPTLDESPRPSIADQVFDALQRHILTLDLAPGAKISEVEVAQQMGVSRQPVRDAFYRLSKLGFLTIRPQRATTISLISEEAVRRAKFIRVALEAETIARACETLTSDDHAALDALVARQAEAVAQNDRTTFHALDEQFHREISERSGVGFAWQMIHESKAHMDRIRMLTLGTASQTMALAEHRVMLDAIRCRDSAAAIQTLRAHLGRIEGLIAQIKTENHSWFTDGSA